MTGDVVPRRYRWAMNLIALLSATAIILAGWALYARLEQTNEARANNKRVWHAVICQIEQSIKSDKTHKYADGERNIILKFYDNLLTQDVHTTGCGLVPPNE